MKKTLKIGLTILAALALLALAVYLVYPLIEFKRDGVLYACRFSDDFSEFEENSSYNEIYFYYEKQDVSLKTFNVQKFLCFYLLSFDYVEGDARRTMFTLEEEYVQYWLENAEIKENSCNIDLAAEIAGKTAVVGNTRYMENDYERGIYFVLDGRYDELYVFEQDGMTVIQVGSPDECPRFIAYK